MALKRKNVHVQPPFDVHHQRHSVFTMGANTHPSLGDDKRKLAKVNMWLFYQANKNLLHEYIKMLRNEVLENIIVGDSLVDAFYLAKDRE